MGREEMSKDTALMLLGEIKHYLSQGNPVWVVKDVTEAIDIAIEAVKTVQEHEDVFEWCTGCREYDQEAHCCHRWSKCIRRTIDEIKQDMGIVWCSECSLFGTSECAMREKAEIFDFKEYGYCSYGERSDQEDRKDDDC